MNVKLQDAVLIFKELGWEGVTSENILQMPTGRPEQKQIALAGLKSGDFREMAQISENTYGWRKFIDVDEGKLALFAVRVGVDARRAANILSHGNEAMTVAVIAARGVKYAADFIGYACTSRRRMFEHSSSVFGSVAVRLVDKLEMDIPQSVEYMKDWAVYTAAAMGLSAELRHDENNLPDLNMMKKRFAEHIKTGVAVNAPATGPFGAVLPEGVKRGWLSREKGMELVFLALDASVRPGDRLVWLHVLDELGITDKELVEHAEAFIPLLAAGDSVITTKLAPVLIAQVDDNLLSELILAALSAKTNKAKQVVLKATLCRTCPADAQELAPWLSILAGDKDKTVRSLARRLTQQWSIGIEMPPEEKTDIQGLWQETPPVWQVAPLELGDVSPEVLTELAAALVRHREIIHDVNTEHFLAMVNAVACQNPEAARMSLRGLRPGDSRLLSYIVCWVKGEKPVLRFADGRKPVYTLGKNDLHAPLDARDYFVSLHLGELPCLLSTPSFVDLSVGLSDLVERLTLYKETGTNVLEADLLLALTRLDTKTKTPEAVKTLQTLNVPVMQQTGRKMPVTAGQVVLRYLEHPIKELPRSEAGGYSYWNREAIDISAALPHFPNRFQHYVDEPYAIFPHWGDVVWGAVAWNYYEVYHRQGLVLRQATRRATPLSPGVSINLLGSQRSISPDAAEDCRCSVLEAWERGLLRPGLADVALLDWSTKPPSNLVALAEALDSFARDGVLSVIWPILDELILISLKAPRLLAGTAELAELILAFLPEVQHAVQKGIADRAALELPGIRALAKRSGSSRAVSAAQKVVVLLPPAETTPEKKHVMPVMEVPFDEVWCVPKKTCAPIDDGIAVSVDWADPKALKIFCFTLTIPGETGRVFQVVKPGWYYDLENEGQCQAYIAPPGSSTFVGNKENQVWLHWDKKQRRMAVCDQRDWTGNNDYRPKHTKPPQLPASLLTVVIGLVAQDGDAVYFAPRLLEDFIGNGQIDSDMVRRATQILLQSPIVSPAKLVRTLEKDIKLLPVLWPMLTECIKHADNLVTDGNPPPVWVNRILDITLRYAPYLSEATKQGLLKAEETQWTGLKTIAGSKAKSTAVGKAKKLLEMLL